jgi:hypothetical protein
MWAAWPGRVAGCGGGDGSSGSGSSMTDDPELREATKTLSERLAAGDATAFAGWFAAHGGEAPIVIWSPAPDQLATPQLRFLLEHWNSLRASRTMPGRGEISPLDLRPALGFVSLVDVVGDGFDFCYRLYGTASAQRVGFDMTGRSVWTFPTEPWLLVFHAAVYRATLLRGQPLYTRHKPAMRQRVLESQRLALPLADEAGAVTRIVAGIVPAERRYEKTAGARPPEQTR